MNRKIGVWIDHGTAVVVAITDDGEDISVVKADVNKRDLAKADDVRQRVETEHLNTYYDEVIKSIGDCDSIFLIGPGEAKGELQKRLEKAKFGKRSINVEPADKMTEPQIAAKVRDHFTFSRSELGTERYRAGNTL